MADQEMHDAGTELEADTEVDAVTDDEVEVEGFGSINTTRDNIPRHPRPTVAPAPGLGGIAGGAVSGLAIKEQGIK